jgi:hypothetical protein
METRNIFSWLSISVLALVLPATAGAATARMVAAPKISALPQIFMCSRNAVTFFPLAPELNKVYKCNQAVCAGNTVDYEGKQIAGYTNTSQWLLFTMNPSAPVSIAQQNAIIQNANAKANAMRPAGKIIYTMQFFSDFTVPNTGAAYFIGANVTYARCLQKSQPANR